MQRNLLFRTVATTQPDFDQLLSLGRATLDVSLSREFDSSHLSGDGRKWQSCLKAFAPKTDARPHYHLSAMIVCEIEDLPLLTTLLSDVSLASTECVTRRGAVVSLVTANLHVWEAAEERSRDTWPELADAIHQVRTAIGIY